jgi:hypothetical protein
MDAYYIVFMDSMKGMKWMREMGDNDSRRVIENIQAGSQHHTYHIYAKHQMKVPLHGTRYDTYRYCKSVAGSNVTKPGKYSMTYALAHQTSMAWFFTDDMFENCD